MKSIDIPTDHVIPRAVATWKDVYVGAQFYAPLGVSPSLQVIEKTDSMLKLQRLDAPFDSLIILRTSSDWLWHLTPYVAARGGTDPLPALRG